VQFLGRDNRTNQDVIIVVITTGIIIGIVAVGGVHKAVVAIHVIEPGLNGKVVRPKVMTRKGRPTE
jgi:TRAP-type uncharacterized transport system fused permease subunit